MTSYGTLRTWAVVLKLIGAAFVVSAVFGTLVTAVEVTGFWRTLGVIFIGIPVSIFLATLPIALGQLMTAIADVGDALGRG